MVAYILVALTFGALAGYFVGKWWAAAIAVLAPLPFYLGVALGLYGNGLGENWQYGIPLWAVPSLLSFAAGALARCMANDRPGTRDA